MYLSSGCKLNKIAWVTFDPERTTFKRSTLSSVNIKPASFVLSSRVPTAIRSAENLASGRCHSNWTFNWSYLYSPVYGAAGRFLEIEYNELRSSSCARIWLTVHVMRTCSVNSKRPISRSFRFLGTIQVSFTSLWDMLHEVERQL